MRSMSRMRVWHSMCLHAEQLHSVFEQPQHAKQLLLHGCCRAAQD